jgi:tetratricopeptide (TPR) repeat protein
VWSRPRPSCTSATALAAVLLLAGGAAADTITLIDGRTIEVDRAWFEGTEVRYEKAGLLAGMPRRLVKAVNQKTPPVSTSDPDVLAARNRLAAGDATQAVRLLQQALAREPNSLPALEAIIEAYLRLGDARKARDAADRALRLDERCSRCHALRGDALLAMGDRLGAEAEYRRSLLLRPDSDVERKLKELAPPEASPTLPPPSRAAQFRIRYEGAPNESIGTAVLDVLNDTYAEYAKRLGSSPESPVTVELQTGVALAEDGTMPEWAEGMNDGTIRIPAQGLEKPTPHLIRVLRHELAHSFVAERTGGNCPTWLQEGIAQWLEGGDPAREDTRLAIAARQKQLVPLLTLEAPFRNLSEFDAAIAYAESLSAVHHIVKRRGEAGVVRLLSALADGLPSEEALPVALALSYPEFQKSWEDSLKGLPAEATSGR